MAYNAQVYLILAFPPEFCCLFICSPCQRQEASSLRSALCSVSLSGLKHTGMPNFGFSPRILLFVHLFALPTIFFADSCSRLKQEHRGFRRSIIRLTPNTEMFRLKYLKYQVLSNIGPSHTAVCTCCAAVLPCRLSFSTTNQDAIIGC